VSLDHEDKPKLRPVEAFRLASSGDGDGADAELIGLRDSCGLSDVVLTMSAPALHVLSLMDGTRSREEILSGYLQRYQQLLKRETLDNMIDYLQRAHFLDGPSFETFYASLVRAYQEAPRRGMPHAEALGVDAAGTVFERMLLDEDAAYHDGTVRGIVAPHLDYQRGAPCYAAAYGLLRHRPCPDRVVILGTNHFGRCPSVVTTGKDFETPLGVTRPDRTFIERLEGRVGPLREHEFDHAREHSVELQVAWLQYLFGADAFSIVPVLCHDPCGPGGTAPYDGHGVDLRDFAEALGSLIASDSMDTLVVAGADLSHVGAAFGDERPLDETFLAEVRSNDQTALARLERSGPDDFVDALKARNNDTRVCSAGCVFAAAVALRDARPRLIRYHQAVEPRAHNCVTCCAVVFS